MGFKTLVLKNRRLATWFMSSRKASFWEKRAEKKVLERFHFIAQNVPAYQEFLKKEGVNPNTIKALNDFKNLPIIDKKNYISKFPLDKLSLHGTLKDKYLIDRSSGHSDKPFYWPRTRQEDQDYPFYMKLAYEQFYQIHKKSTLMIITLALGTWIGGEKISWATREIALNSKLPFTVITPGYDLDEILEIIIGLKDYYDQIVLVGYPPFVKTVIEAGEKQGINWPDLCPKIGLGGRGYSEQWREYIRKKIGLSPKDFMGIAGGYGAADLGMSVGREYPISVLIRKLAHKNKKLARDLFGEENIPSLGQYDPSNFYIEEINQELIFTCMPGIPLVRYNIHDRGGVIPFTKALEILREHKINPYKLLLKLGYTTADIWQLPFFYVHERSDGAVIVDAANVYPDNVAAAFCSKIGEKIHSFKMKIKTDQHFNETFHIYIELKRGLPMPTGQKLLLLKTEIQKAIIQTLSAQNADFKEVYRRNPKTCKPHLEIFTFGTGPFAQDKNKIKPSYVLKR